MGDTTDPKIRTLEEYFAGLDAAEFDRAADQFTADVTYLHPPMYGDEIRIDGREALLDFFVEVRGPQQSRHHLERTLASEDAVAAVGYVTLPDSDDPVEYFVSYAELVDDRIDYYIGGLLGME
jgi:ketosteroid isomerase-like protein